MPDMAYDADGIRSGGNRAVSAGTAAEAAGRSLLGARISSGAFGQVSGGSELAGGLRHTGETFARTSYDTHAYHVDLDARARRTADMGEELLPETTAIARYPRGSGAIVEGMRAD